MLKVPDHVPASMINESLSVELHVQEQGARVGLRGEYLVVRSRSGEETMAQLALTSGVSVYGNVQVSTQALRELLYRDIPLCFFTTGNWYCGKTAGTFSNVDVRVAQFRLFADEEICLALSQKARRAFIQVYERRMCQKIKHPVFSYKVSYRRVLEVQARLLGHFLLGEISVYPAFNTR